MGFDALNLNRNAEMALSGCDQAKRYLGFSPLAAKLCLIDLDPVERETGEVLEMQVAGTEMV